MPKRQRQHIDKYWGISAPTPSGILRINIKGRTGERVRVTTGTKDWDQAAEFRDKVQAEVWRKDKLNERPVYLWKQAVMRWLTESTKKTLRDDKIHLRFVVHQWGDIKLSAITADSITDLAAARKATGVSNATVNRMLEVVRAILRRAAREWRWIDSAPAVRKLPEPKKRIRWITHVEAEHLIAQLPAHLKPMVRFALCTGLRESNITQLTWEQIDLSRRTAWIHADQMKGETKALAVPLNRQAVDVLRAQVGRHADYVFTYDGHPVTKMNNHAWRKALKRAGISDFRVHDLRHTFASWHVQAGTPLHVLCELLGHSSIAVTMRYAHLGGEHLQSWAENVSVDAVGFIGGKVGRV